MSENVIVVEVYETKTRLRRRKQYRWRACSEGNHKVLASGESYYNLPDLYATVDLLFGVYSTVFRWQADTGSVLLRQGYPKPDES